MVQKDASIFDKWQFVLKGILRNFFKGLSHGHASFVWSTFLVNNLLDPSSLVLNKRGHSHFEVCIDPVQHLMWDSDPWSNVILERINSLGTVNIDPVFQVSQQKIIRKI